MSELKELPMDKEPTYCLLEQRLICSGLSEKSFMMPSQKDIHVDVPEGAIYYRIFHYEGSAFGRPIYRTYIQYYDNKVRPKLN